MNEKEKEVFISYSTKDTDIAYTLLEVFESYGLDCWIAPRNIPKGAQWAEEIDKAIQNARVFVVIVSSHSVESKQVPKEIALAVSACESIFPFRIDDIGLQGTFRYYLSDYQFTDATSDTKQKMTELAEIICSSLGKLIPEMKPENEPIPEPTPKPASETAPRPVPDSASQSTSKANSGKTILIGVIAAAAVIAVIMGIVFSGKGNKNNETANSTVSAVQESTAEDSAASESNAAEKTSEVSTSAEGTSKDSLAQGQSAGTFGIWKRIAYEDRGAATDVNTDMLFSLGDGTPYFSLEDGLSGSAESAMTPDLLLKDSSKYDLTVETSFEDTFDGSISNKSDYSYTIAYDVDDIVMGYNAWDENPTGLSYEDCYPEQFYVVHLTGSFQESPVKKSDVDTWIVYKKQYPIFNKQILPALAGKWKDSMGNLWEFSVKDEELAFKMTDTAGNTYDGVRYMHISADTEKVNFFERIQFEFAEYQTDFYAIVSFDGQKLEMLDQNWDSYVLTKEQ